MPAVRHGSKNGGEVRSNEFFVLGSRDETAGCQLCVASVNDDGTLTLRLRMPDSLAELHGKYLVVPNVRFASGHDVVLGGAGKQHGVRGVPTKAW